MSITEDRDEFYLRMAIAQSRHAVVSGNRPFGATVVNEAGLVVADVFADSVTSGDFTGHAEMQALRRAALAQSRDAMSGCTVYSSTEPCVMCAGAIFWSNIRRVVYGVDAVTLRRFRGAVAEQMDLRMSCRDVFDKSPHSIEVIGPFLEGEALEPHRGFWQDS